MLAGALVGAVPWVAGGGGGVVSGRVGAGTSGGTAPADGDGPPTSARAGPTSTHRARVQERRKSGTASLLISESSAGDGVVELSRLVQHPDQVAELAVAALRVEPAVLDRQLLQAVEHREAPAGRGGARDAVPAHLHVHGRRMREQGCADGVGIVPPAVRGRGEPQSPS